MARVTSGLLCSERMQYWGLVCWRLSCAEGVDHFAMRLMSPSAVAAGLLVRYCWAVTMLQTVALEREFCRRPGLLMGHVRTSRLLRLLTFLTEFYVTCRV